MVTSSVLAPSRAAPAAQPEAPRPTATTGGSVIYDVETGEIVDEPSCDWWITEVEAAECADHYARRAPLDDDFVDEHD